MTCGPGSMRLPSVAGSPPMTSSRPRFCSCSRARPRRRANPPRSSQRLPASLPRPPVLRQARRPPPRRRPPLQDPLLRLHPDSHAHRDLRSRRPVPRLPDRRPALRHLPLPRPPPWASPGKHRPWHRVFRGQRRRPQLRRRRCSRQVHPAEWPPPRQRPRLRCPARRPRARPPRRPVCPHLPPRLRRSRSVRST